MSDCRKAKDCACFGKRDLGICPDTGEVSPLYFDAELTMSSSEFIDDVITEKEAVLQGYFPVDSIATVLDAMVKAVKVV